MNRDRPVVQSGNFVPSGPGSRFRLLSEPADQDLRGTVIFVHGFAEEMNKSRRMAARMARMLAADGWRVVQRDLYGCGDSSGDFGDATWSDWVADVEDENSQVIAHRPAWLWCLRAGALLASAALSKHPNVNLLLWQPVLSGAQHLQQFLRLHAGARIVGTGKDDRSPMQMLRSGTGVELGGYQLSSALAMGLAQAKFDLPDAFASRIVWFEVSDADTLEMLPQSAGLIERLRARNIVVESEVLRGLPFWQTQEIEECESLLERTRAKLAAPGRSGPDANVQELGVNPVVTDGAAR